MSTVVPVGVQRSLKRSESASISSLAEQIGTATQPSTANYWLQVEEKDLGQAQVDYVGAFAYNMTTGGVIRDAVTDATGVGLFFESYFEQGGKNDVEVQLRCAKDGQTERRAWQVSYDRDGHEITNFSLEANRYNFEKGEGSDWIRFDAALNQIQFVENTTVVGDNPIPPSNSYSPFQVKNAADTGFISAFQYQTSAGGADELLFGNGFATLKIGSVTANALDLNDVQGIINTKTPNDRIQIGNSTNRNRLEVGAGSSDAVRVWNWTDSSRFDLSVSAANTTLQHQGLNKMRLWTNRVEAMEWFQASANFDHQGQNCGFFGKGAQPQAALIPDVPTAGGENAADNATAINALIKLIKDYGLMAES